MRTYSIKSNNVINKICNENKRAFHNKGLSEDTAKIFLAILTHESENSYLFLPQLYFEIEEFDNYLKVFLNLDFLKPQTNNYQYALNPVLDQSISYSNYNIYENEEIQFLTNEYVDILNFIKPAKQ